ncbi:stage III sporulation protein SpoIIIAB [Clostridium uliginosum]|uniref:Stage III sporulation protein AB n=1 Tax=Clostridium uliginosum TaxID=119641 RepID=A0A1I1NGF3_9CLOT|nr:stage III sporulation protein SpoIIIAB [Clostridium uliginosum]SFC96607.1 stage III sporulation protein AB [Clostridium uliginosum]
MFKLILISMLFVTSSYIGFMYGETFRKRCDEVKEILKALIILQNEIIYGSTPLPEALETLKVKVNSPLDEILDKTNKKLIQGNVKSVYQAFNEEFMLLEEKFYLSQSDKRIIGDFLKSLGESGVFGQEKIFNLAIENIKINLKEAEDISRKNIKVYRCLGICVGAMLTIFLI